jgi:hypothetical protein
MKPEEAKAYLEALLSGKQSLDEGHEYTVLNMLMQCSQDIMAVNARLSQLTAEVNRLQIEAQRMEGRKDTLAGLLVQFESQRRMLMQAPDGHPRPRAIPSLEGRSNGKNAGTPAGDA